MILIKYAFSCICRCLINKSTSILCAYLSHLLQKFNFFFFSFSSSHAAHIKLNFWARSCHVKSLSYQHPLCLSPGCYLIGFHLPYLPLSPCLHLSLSAESQPRPASLLELLSYALSPPAIGLPIRGKWKIVFFLFFFILFYFIPLLVATRCLCVFDAIFVVCREASLASPSPLSAPVRLLTVRLSLFVLRLLSNFSITSIQFARFGFAALNKWPQLR